MRLSAESATPTSPGFYVKPSQNRVGSETMPGTQESSQFTKRRNRAATPAMRRRASTALGVPRSASLIGRSRRMDRVVRLPRAELNGLGEGGQALARAVAASGPRRSSAIPATTSAPATRPSWLAALCPSSRAAASAVSANGARLPRASTAPGRSPVPTSSGAQPNGAALAKRGCVERNFGLLKNHYGLTPLRTRGRERVALHADLTMLARLSQALARARAVTLAA